MYASMCINEANPLISYRIYSRKGKSWIRKLEMTSLGESQLRNGSSSRRMKLLIATS